MRTFYEYNYLYLFGQNSEDNTGNNTGNNLDIISTYVWLNALNVIFAMWSLYLQILHFQAISNMYDQLRKRHNIAKDNKKDYRQKLRQKRKDTLTEEEEEEEEEKEPTMRINDSINNSASSLDKSEIVIKESIKRAETDEINPENIPLNWASLTLADRTKLYNFWTFIIIMGDIFLIIGSAFYIVNSSNSFKPNNHILGISALAHWAATLKYMEGLKDYNIVANTFQNSVVIVSKAIAGIMPLIIAFLLLGM